MRIKSKIKNSFLLILVTGFLCSCGGIGFGMGYKHIEPIKYKYNKLTNSINIKTKNNDIYVKFYDGQCGSYGFIIFFLLPIPGFQNKDCQNLDISISKLERNLDVYISVDNKKHYPINYDKKYSKYKFNIDYKKLKKSATLVIKKNKEEFRVPFKYSHIFSFETFGN